MIEFFQNSWLALLLTAVISYLLGSISSAILVTKAFSKQDIRDFGSGNAGATNVLRSQGKLPALLTTVGDLAKSMLSVFAGGWLLPNLQLTQTDLPMFDLQLVGCYIAGFFCFIGHLYPLYFGFRGGKGIMTALGMLLILDWRVAVILLAVFIVTLLLSRMVSLGSVLAAAILPVVTWLIRSYADGLEWRTVAFCVAVVTAMAVLAIWKHRTNIVRILHGTESKMWGG
jgi:glycerol-3-phosphate acyltransferase PlsY